LIAAKATPSPVKAGGKVAFFIEAGEKIARDNVGGVTA
jgi:hypothetical protein